MASDNEITTVGGAEYDYTHLAGGGYFTLKQDDFIANTATLLTFRLTQKFNNVRAIIIKDGIEVLNTTVIGTLNHSNYGTINFGSALGISFVAGDYVNITIQELTSNSGQMIIDTYSTITIDGIDYSIKTIDKTAPDNEVIIWEAELHDPDVVKK